MNNDTRSATNLIDLHRESIDRLDAILIYTLAERFKYTDIIGKIKSEYNLPSIDNEREKNQITRLKQLSKSANLNPEFAEQFLNFIIKEVIKNHNKCKL
jgi:chorismate mutase